MRSQITKGSIGSFGKAVDSCVVMLFSALVLLYVLCVVIISIPFVAILFCAVFFLKLVRRWGYGFQQSYCIGGYTFTYHMGDIDEGGPLGRCKYKLLVEKSHSNAGGDDGSSSKKEK